MRTIDTIILSEDQGFLVLEFHAQTFLWHQIRRMVSAICKVVTHDLSVDAIRDALDHPEISVDFGLAPSKPLLLTDVIYDFEFDLLPGKKQQLIVYQQRFIDALKK
jgi:tRNA U38,U39,U40 pseudouridine synthase TruA